MKSRRTTNPLSSPLRRPPALRSSLSEAGSSVVRHPSSVLCPPLAHLLSALCVLFLCSVLPLASVAGPEPELATIRGWTNHCASPLNIQGLPNAFKVTDTLYRGAQPTAEGFEELKKIGIKTVVCLRDHHSDKDLLGDTELKYEAIPLNTWSVKEDDIVRFLKIVTDTNNLPLFVHCQHGADRTGTMVATYRMALCGWKKEDAIDEMVNGGFGFHKTWDNLVDLLRGLDVAALKKKAGITK